MATSTTRSDPMRAQSAPVVRWRVVDSPIGPLGVAATERGVVRIDLRCTRPGEVVAELTARLAVGVSDSPGHDAASRHLDQLVAELDEYFAGVRREFEVACDLSLVDGFTRRVVEALALIPYGDRWSYGAVAEAVGHPRAARAVGTACGNNPIPLVHPCHRVVRGDGSLGLYGGGEDMKAALLRLEAEALQNATIPNGDPPNAVRPNGAAHAGGTAVAPGVGAG